MKIKESGFLNWHHTSLSSSRQHFFEAFSRITVFLAVVALADPIGTSICYLRLNGHGTSMRYCFIGGWGQLPRPPACKTFAPLACDKEAVRLKKATHSLQLQAIRPAATKDEDAA